jgi:hypothetical protein
MEISLKDEGLVVPSTIIPSDNVHHNVKHKLESKSISNKNLLKN